MSVGRLSIGIAILFLITLLVACQRQAQSQSGFEGPGPQEQHAWRLLVVSGDSIGWLTGGKLEVLYRKPENAPNSYYLGGGTLRPGKGQIVFAESAQWEVSQLRLMELETGSVRSLFKATQIEGPQWAPNGSTLAFQGKVTPQDEYGLYLYDPGAELQNRFTRIRGRMKQGEGLFSWSPDSKRMVCQDAENSILILDLERKATRRVDSGWFPTWSPNGRYIAYRVDEPTDAGYVLYDLQNEQKQTILSDEPIHRSLVWSPDSRYVAYSKVSRSPSERLLSANGDEIYGDIYIMGLEDRRETKLYSHNSSVYPVQWVALPGKSHMR